MEVNNFDNSLQTGTVLKGTSYSYRIERTLGQGSFGITYLASVKITGALGAIDANIKVAIKEFFMKDINGRSDTTVTSGSKGGLYDEYKHKFTREALNLSKLQHPNIIKVIESFEANNTFYYVMEYIGGGSLDKYIAEHNGLKEDEAIRIIKQIGSALSFMHKNKMLHLDVKPSNIMMKESGDVVLIDFGLSKQYDEKGEPESSTKVGAGTPGYAPLEQANYREGKGFPVTMDVYALGATLFKMLTGVRPPEASDILNDGFPLYELQERNISERLSASIAKAMAPTKKDRYSSVKNFVNSFEEEGTVIDVEVATENVSHKEYSVEKVFKVRLNTSKVTFEFHPRTPIFQGSYFCSVNKETGVDTNITQESTHIGRKLNEREYTKFLNDLQSLNLKIKDKEIPPYRQYEYSESPSKLTITLYDENNKVYNKLWISGWNNELGNIDGNLHAIEEKVRQIVPMLQEYIDSPYYEIPLLINKEGKRKFEFHNNRLIEDIESPSNKKNLLFEKFWLSILSLTHFILLCGALYASQFNSHDQDWFATYHRLLSISWFLGLLACGFLLKRHTKSGMTILFISFVAPFICSYLLKPYGFNGFTEMAFQFAAFMITYAVKLQAKEGGNQVIKFTLYVGIIAFLLFFPFFNEFGLKFTICTIFDSMPNIKWCIFLIISFIALYVIWPKTFKNSITSIEK